LNSAKQEVFETREYFENLLMSSINSFSSINYRKNETAKYMQIKCKSCVKFSFWFTNKDDKDMNQVEEGELVNLMFLRSINQNDHVKGHPEIEF